MSLSSQEYSIYYVKDPSHAKNLKRLNQTLNLGWMSLTKRDAEGIAYIFFSLRKEIDEIEMEVQTMREVGHTHLITEILRSSRSKSMRRRLRQ